MSKAARIAAPLGASAPSGDALVSIALFSGLAYAVSQVTNQAPSNPIITPINGLEIANQSGIASRKGSESCLRRRQRAYLSMFVFTILRLFSVP